MSNPNNTAIPPKKIQIVRGGLDDSVNKFANSLRVFGAILVMISLIATVSHVSSIYDFYSILGIFCFGLFICGSVMLIIGEKLWRMLQKYSETTKPMFSLFNKK